MTICDLYEGDCLDVMPLFVEDKSVDLILCDLPYGTTACSWDSVIPMAELWAEYRRVITDRGAIILTATNPFGSLLVTAALDLFKYEWVWNKTRVTDFVRAKLKPMTGHENVLVFSKGTVANGSDRLMFYRPQGLVRVNKTVRNGKIASQLGTATTIGPNNKLLLPTYQQEFSGYPNTRLDVPSETKTIHPTQKPVALFEYLIKTYTDEGMTVLDNCMGSGTTGVACANTGRGFIGIEKDPGYFAAASARIAAARPLA